LLFDGRIPGFAARMTPKGSISFVLDYSMHGRQRRYTIGKYPGLSIPDAQKTALRLRAQILEGVDPMQTRMNDRRAPTMRELAADYFIYYADKSKRAASLRNDHQMLENIILPELGTLPVSAVSRRDVERLHAKHRKTPCQANRVLALLSKMFSGRLLCAHRERPSGRCAAKKGEELTSLHLATHQS
jgi:hypothetical protein